MNKITNQHFLFQGIKLGASNPTVLSSLTTFDQVGPGRYLTAAPDGRLWMGSGASLTAISTDGEVARVFDDDLTEPVGVAATPDGRVWFTDPASDRIGYVEVEVPPPPTPQPDARIKRTGGTFVGDDVYNDTGVGQSRSATVPRRGWATFVVKVQNDAEVDDSLLVTGTTVANAEFRARYFDDTGEITDAVGAGTYATPSLGPGSWHRIRVSVRVKSTAGRGAVLRGALTAASALDGAAGDRVRYVVRRG